MKAYAGIDLHSSNNYLGVIDSKDKRLFGKRLPNCINTITSALKPFRKSLAGIVVESTYNWYWLVDGLQASGYKLHLANPSAIRQYEGLKHTDDKWDSFWLAHMLRLGILPEGYSYPKQQRAVRDLLRRRLLFVRQRVTHMLSLKSMITRNLGINVPTNEIRKMKEEKVVEHICACIMAKDIIDITIKAEIINKILRRMNRSILSLAGKLA